MQTIPCPDCNKLLLLSTKPTHWGGASKFVYLCQDYPNCKGLCSARPDGEPQGIAANAETRLKRKELHNAFDIWWKQGRLTRTQSYRKLAKELELDVEDCHVSLFDADMCDKALKIVKGWERGRVKV